MNKNYMKFELVDNTRKNIYNESGYQKFRKKYVTNLNGGSTKKLLELIEECL